MAVTESDFVTWTLTDAELAGAIAHAKLIQKINAERDHLQPKYADLKEGINAICAQDGVADYLHVEKNRHVVRSNQDKAGWAKARKGDLLAAFGWIEIKTPVQWWRDWKLESMDPERFTFAAGVLTYPPQVPEDQAKVVMVGWTDHIGEEWHPLAGRPSLIFPWRKLRPMPELLAWQMRAVHETWLVQCEKCREPTPMVARDSLPAWVCPKCGLNNPRPPDPEATYKAELATRQRMLERGGEDAYRVKSGKS